jgi:hypothetical protein
LLLLLQLDDWVLCRIYNKKGAPERPSAGKASPAHAAVGSPPEQKPALLPPYAPPPFSDLAAYYEVRPSDSMPRAHADSSCSEHVLTASCGSDRPEVQSQPKISEWERTFATAGTGVNPAGSMLAGQLDPAAGLPAGDPLLQDILMYWGKPF